VLVGIAAVYVALRLKYQRRSPQTPKKPPTPFSAQIVAAYAIVCLGFGIYFLNNWHDYSNRDPYGVGVEGITKFFGYEQFVFAAITLATSGMIFFNATKAPRGVWAITFIALDWVFNDYTLCAAYSERYRTPITSAPNFNAVLFGFFMAVLQITFAWWFTRYWKKLRATVGASAPSPQSTEISGAR
jgi:hypothetical protein